MPGTPSADRLQRDEDCTPIRGQHSAAIDNKPRTVNSALARRHIESEYHVQSFLWTILAPVFTDLEDEENFPSVGHKRPRADLGIPSLRTLVEVKFLRSSGQAALAKVIEEVVADTSLDLSTDSGYDNIMVVVWEDSAQTEQHHELKTRLEFNPGDHLHSDYTPPLENEAMSKASREPNWTAPRTGQVWRDDDLMLAVAWPQEPGAAP